MNDYAKRPGKTSTWWLSLCAVVALHALLLWAIQSGLSIPFVKTAKAPVQAMLLEEVQPVLPPPPPPPPVRTPPPNVPPPAYVPPVAVPVNTPPPVNAIAAVTSKPQPETPPTPAPAPVVTAPPVRLVCTGAVIAAANCEKLEYASASRRL